MIPKNITPIEAVRLRARARKMLDLRSLKWSQREMSVALGISRAMVVKTLSKVDGAEPGSLYWKLTVCDGDHAVNVKCYDLECWLCEENPIVGRRS